MAGVTWVDMNLHEEVLAAEAMAMRLNLPIMVDVHTIADLDHILDITTLAVDMDPRALPRHAMAIITQVPLSVAGPAAIRIMGDTISLRTIAITDTTRVMRKKTTTITTEKATTTASRSKRTKANRKISPTLRRRATQVRITRVAESMLET